MIDLDAIVHDTALLLTAVASVISGTMILVLVVERTFAAAYEAWLARMHARYVPLVERALTGDEAARAALAHSPSRHHIVIARLLLLPLITSRDVTAIAAAREILRAMKMISYFERMLRSRRWWQRAIGLRVLGGLQETTYTAQLVAALDDPNREVRNAAVDALADMQNPAALPALVVRVHDSSFHRGRLAAAFTAYGPRCESVLLDLAYIDADNRANYARALSMCGTATSRPVLCEWIVEAPPDVSAEALGALARIGLDERAASVAMHALEHGDVTVRAMAAGALSGWNDAGAAAILARHLDDAWPVAVRAAHALRAMPGEGRRQLEARASDNNLAGLLARQMLWEPKAS